MCVKQCIVKIVDISGSLVSKKIIYLILTLILFTYGAIKEAESGSYKPLAIMGIIYLIFLIALISSCSSSPNYL